MIERSEQRLKHLEFLQAAISRQAGNQFLVRGWALTVAAALYAFAADRSRPLVSATALVPVLCFAWLDVYFVRQERAFRALFAAAASDRLPMFELDPDACGDDAAATWSRSARSLPVLVLHGTAVVVGVALLIATSADAR